MGVQEVQSLNDATRRSGVNIFSSRVSSPQTFSEIATAADVFQDVTLLRRSSKTCDDSRFESTLEE